MGGRAAAWLVLLVEDCCCYSLQVAALPPSLPLQPMRGPWWRVGTNIVYLQLRFDFHYLQKVKQDAA